MTRRYSMDVPFFFQHAPDCRDTPEVTVTVREWRDCRGFLTGRLEIEANCCCGSRFIGRLDGEAHVRFEDML